MGDSKINTSPSPCEKGGLAQHAIIMTAAVAGEKGAEPGSRNDGSHPRARAARGHASHPALLRMAAQGMRALDAWTRVIWRLRERAEGEAKDFLRAQCPDLRKGRKKPQLPSDEQLSCRHPRSSRFSSGNQYASYTYCRECGVCLMYEPRPKIRATSTPQTVHGSSSPGTRSPGSSDSSVRRRKDILDMLENNPQEGHGKTKKAYAKSPPKDRVEAYVDKALQPVIQAQVRQQQTADTQGRVLNHILGLLQARPPAPLVP